MPKAVRVEVFRGHDQDFWWRAVAGNHRIVGGSTEGYWSKWYCKRKALRQFPDAVLVDKT